VTQAEARLKKRVVRMKAARLSSILMSWYLNEEGIVLGRRGMIARSIG